MLNDEGKPLRINLKSFLVAELGNKEKGINIKVYADGHVQTEGLDYPIGMKVNWMAVFIYKLQALGHIQLLRSNQQCSLSAQGQ